MPTAIGDPQNRAAVKTAGIIIPIIIIIIIIIIMNNNQH
jgi:hypothetical protein